jgi:DNA polymerase-3 subunit alpha
VVLHPVTFLNKKDFNAHRLLRAIDNNTLLSKLPVSEQTNENELFYEEVKLLQLYEDYPQLVINTRRITDACSM